MNKLFEAVDSQDSFTLNEVDENIDDNFEQNLMDKLRNFISNIDGIENVSEVDYAPYAADGEYFVSFDMKDERYYIALGSHEE